ncbi:hypothetical protein ACWPM1_01130 [Tsuneonella sp. HG249]
MSARLFSCLLHCYGPAKWADRPQEGLHDVKVSTASLALALSAVTLPAAAAGQDTPAVVTAVYQCRTVSDGAARLACFDTAAAQLEKAEGARTLVFGDQDDFARFEGPELASKIEQVRANKVGQWVITLPDGTRWLQTDQVELRFPPKSGDSIVIRRGLMGNYRAKTRGTGFQVRQIG